MRKLFAGFLTRSNTNWAVQAQKMTKGLTFLIKKVEGLYYPGSENKPADQLHDYIAADLCLFLHMQKAGFLMTPLIIHVNIKDVNECSNIRIFVFRSNIRIRFLNSNIRIF